MDLVSFTQRFPEPGETVVGSRFLTYPGGKGANQAVAAARMGARVRMIGRVGGDAFGGQLLQSLECSGVDVSGVVTDSKCTSGIAAINIDASGQNRIVQIPGANQSCGEEEVQRAKEAMADASVLMLQLEVPLEVSVASAKEAADGGKLVMLDPGPARPLPQGLYKHCSYITPNETEAGSLIGFPVMDVATAAGAAQALLSRGAGGAVIKMGALGAYYATGHSSQYLPAFHVEAVDTVAAGDAFNGALAVAIAEGRGLEDAMRWAMAAGALAVTRLGAQDSMPQREEVEAYLASQQDG